MQTVIQYFMMFFTGTLLQAQASKDFSQLPLDKETIVSLDTCHFSPTISEDLEKDETLYLLFGEVSAPVKDVSPYSSFY